MNYPAKKQNWKNTRGVNKEEEAQRDSVLRGNASAEICLGNSSFFSSFFANLNITEPKVDYISFQQAFLVLLLYPSLS